MTNGIEAPPKEKDFLERVVQSIPTEWYQFGLALEIPIEKLDRIKHNSDTTVTLKFMRVFRIWKSSTCRCAPFTWETIIDLLRGHILRNNALADKLTHTLQPEIV